MHISAVPLTPDDLRDCAALWPDRVAFTDDEFARALRACAELLRTGRALGSAVREGGILRAYGISTFVHEHFADEYMVCTHPQVGKRLLLEGAGNGTVLDWHGLAERNAGRGLQLVVVSTNYDVSAREPVLPLGELIRAYMETHRGYRIARIINEVIGQPAVEVLTMSGAYDVHRTFCCLAPDIPVPSAVGVLTRERAAARRSPIAGMFAYNPPRVPFTAAEQQLLRAGLDGAPDEVVSMRMGIPVSAVKARWTRIYQRVEQCLPDLVEHVRVPHLGDRRGAQIRHVVLEYIRRNPSELTPYQRRAGEC